MWQAWGRFSSQAHEGRHDADQHAASVCAEEGSAHPKDPEPGIAPAVSISHAPVS